MIRCEISMITRWKAPRCEGHAAKFSSFQRIYSILGRLQIPPLGLLFLFDIGSITIILLIYFSRNNVIFLILKLRAPINSCFFSSFLYPRFNIIFFSLKLLNSFKINSICLLRFVKSQKIYMFLLFYIIIM